jgi:predicted O-methyltransferase YrrM
LEEGLKYSMKRGGNVDFLFIDGDHRYEGVKRDFEMYSPLVRRERIIAFHDIVPEPPENVGGVPDFWNEIKHGFSHVEDGVRDQVNYYLNPENRRI